MKSTGFLVNSLDLFGQQLNMQIFGKEKRKTIFGAIVGLISLALIGIVSIYFLVGFFKKDTKTVIQNQDTTILPYNNLTEIPIIIGVRTPFGVDIPNDGTIFNVHAYMRVDNFTKGIFYGATFNPLPLYNCTQAHFGKFDIEATPVAKKQMCLKTGSQNNLRSFAVEPVNGFNGLFFILTRCNNLTNPNCKSKETIDTALEGGFFSFTTMANSIDNNNVTIPSQLMPSTIILSTSISLFKRKTIYLTQNIYQDDVGFLFDSYTTYDFFTIGADTTDYSLNYPTSFLALTKGEIPVGQITVFNTEYVQRTYRSYMKAQTVLAQIGGIIKFIMTVAAFITNFVTRKLIFAEIGDYVFDYTKPVKKKAKRVKTIAREREEINVQEIQSPEVKLHPIVSTGTAERNNLGLDNSPRLRVRKIHNPALRTRKSTNYFKLSLWDQICTTGYARNKGVMRNYDLTEAAVFKKASVESIVADSYRLEELGRITLNNYQYSSLFEGKLNFKHD